MKIDVSNDNKTIHKVDFCVVGGGLAGTIAAISAARRGVKVVLMQDRPMLGGNCSSEVRLYIRGAVNLLDRETGILNEFEEENIYRNSTLSNTVWDSVLMGAVLSEPNITLLTNCSCLSAEKDGKTIAAVLGWQLNTYTFHEVRAKYFADCSGDSILAGLLDIPYMYGREAKTDFNESYAQDVADKNLMGMSCLLQARETDRKVEFIPPKWANVYLTNEDLGLSNATVKERHLRDDTIGTNGCNLWWMEFGGDLDGIKDTDKSRNELLKIVFGTWDYIKNRSKNKAENWELEWVGFLPGKRESRRCVGKYILKQDDVLSCGDFPDVVAYGGWPIDDHDPQGMKTKSLNCVNKKLDLPYGIPLRCLYANDVDNLLFAGRNISATHVALSSTRVLATCALMGQAVGTTVAVCNKYGIFPDVARIERIKEIQQDLFDDGVFLPYAKRDIPSLSLNADVNLSDKQKEILFSGIERPTRENAENFIELDKGAEIIYEFNKPKEVSLLRIQGDLDFTRKSISPHLKIQRFAMKMNRGLDFEPVKVANTIIKAFEVFIDGKLVYSTDDNYRSLVTLPLNGKASQVKIKFVETWGYEKIRLYACDIK